MNASEETIHDFTEEERQKASENAVTVTTLEDLRKEVGFYYYHVVFN
jgi:hypothetical protein